VIFLLVNCLQIVKIKLDKIETGTWYAGSFIYANVPAAVRNRSRHVKYRKNSSKLVTKIEERKDHKL